jgi:hypothetical protein
MHALHKNNQLTPEQALFMADSRPKEEFYDLKKDPHELNNLAHDSQLQPILEKFRKILDEWIKNTGDRGEYQEDPVVVNKYKKQMKGWAQDRLDQRAEEK